MSYLAGAITTPMMPVMASSDVAAGGSHDSDPMIHPGARQPTKLSSSSSSSCQPERYPQAEIVPMLPAVELQPAQLAASHGTSGSDSLCASGSSSVGLVLDVNAKAAASTPQRTPLRSRKPPTAATGYLSRPRKLVQSADAIAAATAAAVAVASSPSPNFVRRLQFTSVDPDQAPPLLQEKIQCGKEEQANDERQKNAPCQGLFAPLTSLTLPLPTAPPLSVDSQPPPPLWVSNAPPTKLIRSSPTRKRVRERGEGGEQKEGDDEEEEHAAMRGEPLRAAQLLPHEMRNPLWTDG